MPDMHEPDERLGGLLRQWYPAYYAFFCPERGPTTRPQPDPPPPV